MQAAIETPLMILDTIPEAYVRLDSEGRFTFANHAAQLILGKERSQLLGQHLGDLFSRKRAETGFQRTLNRRAACTFELCYGTGQRWFTVTAIPDGIGGV